VDGVYSMFLYAAGFIPLDLSRWIGAGDSQFVGHSDQLRQRSCAHLFHDLSPMYPNSILGDAKVTGRLFVRETSDHKGEDFPLARREKSVALLQLGQLGSLSSRFAIKDNCSVNCL